MDERIGILEEFTYKDGLLQVRAWMDIFMSNTESHEKAFNRKALKDFFASLNRFIISDYFRFKQLP